MGIFGTDVSNYQPINFLLELPGTSVRPVDFAIIKITEGVSYTNPKWTSQRQWARDHGLSVGFYHFGRPGSMIDQANFFLSRVNLQSGDHLWFDWEDAGISSAQKDQWIKFVQEQRPGHRVGLYCNTSFWKNRDQSSFAGDGLWIATGGIPLGQPPIESPWLIHQFSTEGGYDHDWAQFGSRADMIAWANGNEEDVALSTDDKNWIKSTVEAAVDAKIKALVYSQVWELDRMTPPAGQATEANKTWMAQSLLRYACDRAAEDLAQSHANGASLTEIKMLIDALDLDQLPAVLVDRLTALRFKLEAQA